MREEGFGTLDLYCAFKNLVSQWTASRPIEEEREVVYKQGI